MEFKKKTNLQMSCESSGRTLESFRLVDSHFHAQGLATENALWPIFHLAFGTTRHQLLGDHQDDCKEMLEARIAYGQ